MTNRTNRSIENQLISYRFTGAYTGERRIFFYYCFSGLKNGNAIMVSKNSDEVSLPISS